MQSVPRALRASPALALLDGPAFFDRPLPWLLIGLVFVAAWLVLFVGIAVSTAPRRPEPGPRTMELGPEPPAIANFLARRWKVTSAAAAATLVDLAARRHVEIARINDGTMLIRLRTLRAGPTGGGSEPLAPYEESVLQLIRTRAVNGVLPAPALLEGGTTRWFDGFRRAVESEAIAAGLARKRWSKELGVLLWATLFVSLVPIALALDIWTPDDASAPADRNWIGLFGMAALGALGIVTFGGRRMRGLRHTPAGQAAASRWLGVEEFHEDQRSFLELQADAVAVWDRHLAFACALGQAPLVAATFPLAPQPDDEAWSPATGLWREVEVKVPRNVVESKPPGQLMVPALLQTLFALAGLAVALWLFATMVGRPLVAALTSFDWLEFGLIGGISLVLAIPSVWFALRLRRWGPVLVAAVQDGSTRMVTEGVLVKFATRVLNSGEDDEITLHYSAVDDGSGAGPIVAFQYKDPRIPLYRRVRVEYSPHLRHVYSMTPLPDRDRWATPPVPPAAPEPSA